MLDVIRSLGGSGTLQLSQDNILQMFTSEIAIIIYVFVILAIIAVLVVSVLFSQRQDSDETEIKILEQN